eukprot:11194720-Lingulodinium_polyedra.AAC.1
MMRPGTRWHADGPEGRQETATDMVLELLRGIISWAENGAQFRGQNSVTHSRATLFFLLGLGPWKWTLLAGR